MKIALITPWDNAWIPYFKAAIERRCHEFMLWDPTKPEPAPPVDVVIHGWASGMSQPLYGARNIMFLRRYELFDGGLAKVDWKHVDALIVVNSWIKEVVERIFSENGIKVPVHLIYNGTDLNRWTFKQRKPNNRIGMACHVHPKKNLPLAMQVLSLLPPEYELHIAGDIQDSCTAEYLNHIAKRQRRTVYMYGHVPREQLDLWWEQMGFCLSTSISEGNPNNVIEAMAKGIKPIIHRWPGAEDQFDDSSLFTTAHDAAVEIQVGGYDSEAYRAHVEKHFSLANYERVLDIALQTTEKTNESTDNR